MRDDLPPIVKQDITELWSERRIERRERAIKNESCERLRSSWEKPSLVGEANKLTKYTTKQCTQVRAALEANKRVAGKGLSWVMIGKMESVPYQTVRKLAQKQLSTGRRYRPDAEPTEDEINHFVVIINQHTAQDKQLRADRKQVAQEIYWKLFNDNKNHAGQVQVQRDTGEILWLTDQCAAAGVKVPKSHGELSEAISVLVRQPGADLQKLSTAMQQLATMIDQKKPYNPSRADQTKQPNRK